MQNTCFYTDIKKKNQVNRSKVMFLKREYLHCAQSIPEILLFLQFKNSWRTLVCCWKMPAFCGLYDRVLFRDIVIYCRCDLFI